MKTLQAEHKLWLDAMYPKQDPMFPAVGIVEESGELLHALLKYAQRGVWGDELRYVDMDWRAEMVDAIGDCAIYVCSYCNTVGWDFDALCAVIPTQHNAPYLNRAANLVGLAAAFVNNQTREQLTKYLAELKAIAAMLQLDFVAAVRDTWIGVKQRCR